MVGCFSFLREATNHGLTRELGEWCQFIFPPENGK